MDKYRAAKPPKPCNGKNKHQPDNAGVCMFQYECLQLNGEPIGYCFNSYLVGTCCQLPDIIRKPIQDQQQQWAQANQTVFSSSSTNPTTSTTKRPATSSTLTILTSTGVKTHFIPNNNGQMDLNEDEQNVIKVMENNHSKTPQQEMIQNNTKVESPILALDTQSTTSTNSTVAHTPTVPYVPTATPSTTSSTTTSPTSERISESSPEVTSQMSVLTSTSEPSSTTRANMVSVENKSSPPTLSTTVQSNPPSTVSPTLKTSQPSLQSTLKPTSKTPIVTSITESKEILDKTVCVELFSKFLYSFFAFA